MKEDLTPNAAPGQTAGQTDSECIGAIVQAAQDAFWQRAGELAAEQFGVTAGDLDPSAAVALDQAMTSALTAWIAANRTR